MKVYLAGPMTGHPQFNFPLFDAAAADLRELAYEVVSPAELDDPSTRRAALASPDGAPGSGTANDETWGDFLARDVKLIADGGIDAIVVLPDWHTSRGARLEVTVATLDGKPIYAYEGATAPTALRRLTQAEVDAGKLGHEPQRTDCRGWVQHEVPIDVLRELLKRPYGEQTPAEREALRELMERPHGAKLPAAGEVRVVNEKTGGAKGSKAQQMGLLPYEALMKVSEVYAFGATKYAPNNWRKGYDWSLSFDALQRHLALFWSGEDLDPETGLPHLAHAAFHVLALIVFMLDPQYAELDDRASTVMAVAA